MHIGITGATGLIGKATIAQLISKGHSIVAFTRTPSSPAKDSASPFQNETRQFTLDSPPNLRGIDALIHLAGEPIFGVWTKAKKRRIRESRILLSRHLVDAISSSPERPAALISASGVSYYGDAGDTLLTEASPKGQGFLADLAHDWEKEIGRAAAFDVRTTMMRFGAVLALGGGMFPLVRRVFRLCLGGRLGPGSQWMSWIHLDDAASLLCAAVENPAFSGAVNATAPEPVTNLGFTTSLASALRRPALFPAPAFALRLVLRDLSAVALQSQRCQPSAATSNGFSFAFRDIRSAIGDLLAKEKSR